MAIALSKREWLILRMLGGGMLAKEIALVLSLTENTVDSYAKRGRAKIKAQFPHVIDALDLCLLIERGGLEWGHQYHAT